MKNKMLFAFFLCCSISLFAQKSDDKTVYLDSLGNTSTVTNYKYTRVIKDYYSKTNDLFEVTEYYKSGAKKKTGNSSNQYEMKYTGTSKEFYENGNRKNTTNYSATAPTNKQFEWYENGQKKSETENSFDKENHIPSIKYLQFWDNNNIQTVIDGNGTIEVDTENGFEKGSVKNGNKNGEWNGTDNKYNFTYTENYKDGELSSGTSIDSTGVNHIYKNIYTGFSHNKKLTDLLTEISKELFTKDVVNTEDLFKITVNLDIDGRLFSIVTTPDIAFKLEKIKKRFKKGAGNPILFRGIPILYSFSLTWSPGLNNTNHILTTQWDFKNVSK